MHLTSTFYFIAKRSFRSTDVSILVVIVPGRKLRMVSPYSTSTICKLNVGIFPGPWCLSSQEPPPNGVRFKAGEPVASADLLPDNLADRYYSRS